MDKLVLFDIDGVLEYQGRVYPGAIELVRGLRARGTTIRILSNSTLKSRRTAAQKLRARGFPVEDEEVITASWATARYLSVRDPRSCWVMLKGDGLEELDEGDLALMNIGPAIIAEAARSLRGSGYVIASGFLKGEEAELMERLRKNGLALVARFEEEGWPALLFARESDA